jgi:hypothetical protein
MQGLCAAVEPRAALFDSEDAMSKQEGKKEVPLVPPGARWGRVKPVLKTYGIGRTTLREWIAANLVEARKLGERGDLLINIPSLEGHIGSGLKSGKTDPTSALSESRRQLRLRRKDFGPKKRRLRR